MEFPELLEPHSALQQRTREYDFSTASQWFALNASTGLNYELTDTIDHILVVNERELENL
jgi:hypothetical protein